MPVPTGLANGHGKLGVGAGIDERRVENENDLVSRSPSVLKPVFNHVELDNVFDLTTNNAWSWRYWYAQRMTLTDVNAATRDQFVMSLGWVFEHSPWVAEQAWSHRPFATVDQLHQAMMGEVMEATADKQVALVRAHPDLGTRARMSEASTGEQADAGLANLSRADFERLQSLNAAYRERFGFPFLFAVKGSTTREVLDALAARLSASPEHELAEALRQVSRIAWFRLHETLGT